MQGVGGFLRILAFMVAAYFLVRHFTGGDTSKATRQPIAVEPQAAPSPRAPYRYCEINTDRFHATLTTRGAALKHFALITENTLRTGTPSTCRRLPHPGIAVGDPQAENPATPGEHEFRQQLFVRWRNPTTTTASQVPWNVAFDTVDYQLQQADGRRCDFSYRDDSVLLEKSIAATDNPYISRSPARSPTWPPTHVAMQSPSTACLGV